MIPIKIGREIDKMRQACRTASDVLDRVSELIRPGISTKEIDQAAADLMQEAGVRSAFLGYRLGHRVFPGNICISLNDEIVHGIGEPAPDPIRRHREARHRCVAGWLGGRHGGDSSGWHDRRANRETARGHSKARCDGPSDFARADARLGDLCAAIEDEAIREPLQRRARICRPRGGTEVARRTAGAELRQTRQRPAAEDRA